MRKKLYHFTLCLLIVSTASYAQWGGSTTTSSDAYRDGNVGIGTNTPSSKLTVQDANSNGSGTAAFYSNSTTSGAINIAGYNLNNSHFKIGMITESGNFNPLTKARDRAFIFSDGNYNTGTFFIGPWSGNPYGIYLDGNTGRVGIGTSNPAQSFDVNGNIRTNGSVIIDGGDLLLARTSSQFGFITRPIGAPNLAFAVDGGGALSTVSVNSNLSYFSGNVGIGTATTGTYKLAVEGKIVARGVKVTTGAFADYVFDSTYQLTSLSSLEQYINQNKHLPGIPSADQVQKEGGFELQEMNVKLLEKVEELTLYVIELKKENEQIKKELKKSSKQKK